MIIVDSRGLDWNSVYMNADTNMYIVEEDKTKNSKSNFNDRFRERSIGERMTNAALGFLSFTFISIPRFIGEAIVYTFENISKVIRIDIGFLNAEKVDLCQTINELKAKNMQLEEDNKALDEHNYLLCESNTKLISRGTQMHDELCTIYGKDNFLVLGWREAEQEALAGHEIDYSEAYKYLSVRERREMGVMRPQMMDVFNQLYKQSQSKSKVKTTKTKTAAKRNKTKG